LDEISVARDRRKRKLLENLRNLLERKLAGWFFHNIAFQMQQ
jgi:hypothetical protein